MSQGPDDDDRMDANDLAHALSALTLRMAQLERAPDDRELTLDERAELVAELARLRAEREVLREALRAARTRLEDTFARVRAHFAAHKRARDEAPVPMDTNDGGEEGDACDAPDSPIKRRT